LEDNQRKDLELERVNKLNQETSEKLKNAEKKPATEKPSAHEKQMLVQENDKYNLP
jgi:hypothetical protein|tara:strand:+ start:928 stop:1095 length:168 start_codon:yes stop_codon:yes gene_type:complete